MRMLIAEDDYTSRVMLQRLLLPYGECTVAVNGQEAVEAFRIGIEEGRPFDLVCLDIMMPEMDGHEALDRIRELEREKGIEAADQVKVIMTTALADIHNVRKAIRKKCRAYLIKPYDKQKLLDTLRSLELLDDTPNESVDC